jgi:hypothetical protein
MTYAANYRDFGSYFRHKDSTKSSPDANKPGRTVLVEFTVHRGDEILRDGKWVADWTSAEAVLP